MTTQPVRPTTQMRTVVALDPGVADALRTHLAEVADSVVAGDHRRGAQLCRAPSADGWAR